MAGMRYVRALLALLALLALAASAFCFIEGVIGVFITYGVYKAGHPVRGVPLHSFVSQTAILIAATGLFFWAWLKIQPKRLG